MYGYSKMEHLLSIWVWYASKWPSAGWMGFTFSETVSLIENKRRIQVLAGWSGFFGCIVILLHVKVIFNWITKAAYVKRLYVEFSGMCTLILPVLKIYNSYSCLSIGEHCICLCIKSVGISTSPNSFCLEGVYYHIKVTRALTQWKAP